MLPDHSSAYFPIAGGAFRSWLQTLNALAPASSNVPSLEMPFQRWFKFKEAFSPLLILDCLRRLPTPAKSCLDVFGGCGTTGITCQFAGVHPVLIEVNPFVADLAEAKLQSYNLDTLESDYLRVRRMVRRRPKANLESFQDELPDTLCEPGVNDRWVFSREVLSQVLAYREAIGSLSNSANRRLLQVLLGATLVGLSNVTVNGKGRKYRQNWRAQQKCGSDVDFAIEAKLLSAASDLERYKKRPCKDYEILRGSCLEKIDEVDQVDVAIFSPPYPNSFDYTDIYNLELWILGYLKSREDNQRLRAQTLRSHVQIGMPLRGTVPKSALLQKAQRALERRRESLWDPRLPEMVVGYFTDLTILIEKLRGKLGGSGSAFIVVGDSQYDGVRVPVADILAQIAESRGYRVVSNEMLRPLRASAQQGGALKLRESLLHLQVV